MSDDKIASLEKQVKELQSRLDAVESGKKKKEKVQRPPRQPSEYNKFIKEKYNEIKETNPGMKHSDIFAKCVESWKTR